ncbi:protein of unknown function [Candidatus Filomicrobium marinum]|nr:protein of unknown function [Candidatus Filomicrobium marinum]
MRDMYRAHGPAVMGGNKPVGGKAQAQAHGKQGKEKQAVDHLIGPHTNSRLRSFCAQVT